MSRRWCNSFSVTAEGVQAFTNDAGDYNEALLLTYSGPQLDELYTKITGKPAPTGNTSKAIKVARLFSVAAATMVKQSVGESKDEDEQDDTTNDAEEANDMSTAKKTTAKKAPAKKAAAPKPAKAPAKKAAAPKPAKLPKERVRGQHREGSRKGEMHAWFTDKSPELDAFVKRAVDKGLKESTARGWYSAFKKKAAK